MLSVIFGIIPLLGIVWIVMSGWVTTIDGLFMSLILLAVSGIFLLNAFWEARTRGLLGSNKKAAVPSQSAPAPKTEAQAAKAPAPEAQKTS